MRRSVDVLAALVLTRARPREPIGVHLQKPAPTGVGWEGSQRLSVAVPKGNHGCYPAPVRAVGVEEHVPGIDLTTTSQSFCEALGRRNRRSPSSRIGPIRLTTPTTAPKAKTMIVEGIRVVDPKLAAQLSAGAGRFASPRPDAREQFAVPN